MQEYSDVRKSPLLEIFLRKQAGGGGPSFAARIGNRIKWTSGSMFTYVYIYIYIYVYWYK